VHDFEPGIAPSGLFWTIPIPESAITRHGQSITYSLTNAPTPDFFVFLGGHSVPGTVSFSVTWTAASGVRHLTPGSSDPTDPTNFAAEFRDALPTATFSGSNADGFSFSGSAGPEGNLFSEFGHEQNGVFLHG
jgi:hypothetical protein